MEFPKANITARVIADSISPFDVRLTTFVIHFQRFVHAELMTHRLFSRNAASSRAIPVQKMMQRVIDDPAVPVFWAKNQPGMQAVEEVEDIDAAIRWWFESRDLALAQAKKGQELGLHKQITNRVLEPFFNIEVVLTATDFGNWFNLRNHGDAQQEIHVVAEKMLEAMNASGPKMISWGGWHLPFVEPEEFGRYPIEELKKFSAARCARVSYLNHDGSTPNPEKDLKLYNQLVTSGHWSPLEHVATPLREAAQWSGNFRGWKQHRKEFENEHRWYYAGLK